MHRARAFLASITTLIALTSACATGTQGEPAEGAGAQAPSTTGSSSEGQGASSSGDTTATGTGGAASTASTGTGGADCPSGEHLCGGICAGNTPVTGCSASTTCEPCPAPSHGVAACTPEGACDVACDAKYKKSGASCVCASECCKDDDCTSQQICDDGDCENAGCADQVCFQYCLNLQKCGGFCNHGCQCNSC